MEILHPYLTLIFFLLMLYSYREVYAEEYTNYKGVWWVMVYIVLVAGLRANGPDYRSYRLMYSDFGLFMSYDLNLMKENIYNVEWMYVAYNMVFFQLGIPLVLFLLITAVFTLFTKYYVFEKNSVYPALSFLLFMTPTFFMGDMGHLRQAIATSIVFLSFYAIKKRKLWLFLILIYLAKGFHNSSIIFVVAYFIAILPLNRNRIIALVAAAIIISPFEIYNNISWLESIAPQEVYEGFTNYNEIMDENSGTIKFNDILSFFYLYFILFYDKEACERIPYYEYMRNIAVAGICLYFVFRQSPIFSTRLVSYYFLFMVLVIPNIVAAVQNIRLKRYLFTLLIMFVVIYYFVFANMQGKREFTTSTFSNILFGG